MQPNFRILSFNKFISRYNFGAYLIYESIYKFYSYLARFSTYPVGLAYIAAVLEKQRHEVDIIDAYIENLNEIKLLTRIQKYNPNLVGITTAHSPAPVALQVSLRLSGLIKELNNKIITVLGGVGASFLSKEDFRSSPSIDFLIRGEGEQAFSDLISAIDMGMDFARVDNLTYRPSPDIVVVNARQGHIEDLDTIPFPARHLLLNHRYQFKGKRETIIVGSRGCSYKCSFCYARKLFGNRVRKRAPVKIIDEIERCLLQYNMQDFTLVDQTFTHDKEYVYSLIDELFKRRLNRRIRWKCVTRVDCVDGQLLKSMRMAGCVKIGIGVENGSQVVLEGFNKNITLAQIEEMVCLARKNNILTVASVIINQYANDVYGMIKTTNEFLERIKPDRVNITPLIVYPDTELFQELIKQKAIKVRCGLPVYEGIYMAAENLSYDEISRAIKRMYFNFYSKANLGRIIMKQLFC